MALLFWILAAAQVSAQDQASSPPEDSSFVVVAVRHAEKLDKSRDAQLSDAGKSRAERLSTVLSKIPIGQIFSTDFARTRDTAAPTASKLGLSVEIYDPRSLSELARRLVRTRRNALVVGHSNTTPELVRLLGGPDRPMGEDEYDVMFVLVFDAKAAPELVHTLVMTLPAQ